MSITIVLFSGMSNLESNNSISWLSYLFTKLLLFSFLILPFILIDSKHKLLLSFALSINIACILLMDKVSLFLGVGYDYQTFSYSNFERINVLVLFPIIVLIIGYVFLTRINARYEDELLNKNLKLEAANAHIIRANADFTESISYATRIQNAVLPNLQKIKSVFADSFIYFKPKAMVSGDFYFIKNSKIQDEDCVVLAVSDCTGHGVPGAFMSMLGITLLNDVVREGNFSNAADVLDKLREEIKIALNQSEDNLSQSDGIELALIILFPEQKRLQFAGAKNPMYLINAEGELNIFKGDRMPISYYLKEEPFSYTQIELQGEEMCYLFTDGIIDQMNVQGEKFLGQRLKEYLLTNHMKPADSQLKQLELQMKQWQNNDYGEISSQTDDMLLLGIRIP